MDAQVNKGHGSARYSGLEMMQMMLAGEREGPAIAKLLNYRITAVEEGAHHSVAVTT